MHTSRQMRRVRCGADRYFVVAGQQLPLFRRDVEYGKVSGIEGDSDGLGFAWRKLYSLPSCQALERLSRARGKRYVDLRDLSPGNAAGIAQLELQSACNAICFKVGVLEGGIGETVAKGNCTLELRAEEVVSGIS
jgi:hypothetical protein